MDCMSECDTGPAWVSDSCQILTLPPVGKEAARQWHLVIDKILNTKRNKSLLKKL